MAESKNKSLANNYSKTVSFFLQLCISAISGKMKTRLFIFFLISVTLTSCLGRMFTQRQFRKGKEALAANDIENAYVWFDKAARGNKKLGDAYYFRGLISERRGNLDAALSDFIHAFTYSENQSLSGLAAGRLLIGSKKYKESLPYLEQSFADDSTNYQTGFYLMIALIAGSKAEDALLLFDKFPEAGTNGRLNYAKALASDSLGIYDYAGVFYRTAIDLDKTNPEAYIDYARLLVKTGNDMAALDVATEGISLFNHAELMKIRMAIYASKYQWHSAISEATTLFNLTRGTEYIERRARFYQFLGLLNNALNDYSFVLSLEPNNTNALFNRAIVNMRINNEEAVFSDITKFLKLETASTPSWQSNRAREIISLLGKEIPPPTLTITQPVVYNKQFLGVDQRSDSLLVKGNFVENARINSLTINGFEAKKHVFSERIKIFLQQIPWPKDDTVRVEAVDMYDNVRELSYPLLLHENDAPEIMIFTPPVDTLQIAQVERKGRFFNLKFFTADKNYISGIYVNGMELYSGFNKRTMLMDTMVPVPANNRVVLSVKDVFNNESKKEFILEYSTKNQSIADTKDILLLLFKGFDNSFQPDSLKHTELEETLAKTSNLEMRIIENTSKRMLERYLMFDLPTMVAEKKFKDLIIWFCGKGIEESEASYWLPSDADTTRKQTWFNLSFLSSTTKMIQLRGTLIYITGTAFVPERLTDNRGKHQNTQALVFKNNPQPGDSLSITRILDTASIENQKVDFIALLEQLAMQQPQNYRAGWLKDHYRTHSMPVILFWKP
jgi:tetratricopeptide (TPR) repeat protein